MLSCPICFSQVFVNTKFKFTEGQHQLARNGSSKTALGWRRKVGGGTTYSCDFFHITDHIFVAFALLGETSVVDVVVSLPVNHVSFYNFYFF